MQLPRFVEDLRDMHHLYSKFAATDNAFEMHKARHISSGDDFCAVTYMIVYAIFTHPHGDRLFGYRERTAEATAFIRPVELHQLNILYFLQEAQWFVVVGFIELRRTAESQPTDTVTSGM